MLIAITGEYNVVMFKIVARVNPTSEWQASDKTKIFVISKFDLRTEKKKVTQ
ncbi:MAG: hypothetical protein ACI9C4_000996 [Paraglaciecola sp.]|jgi:hypothetical protein